MVDTEKVLTRQLIVRWHERARIDYSDLFMREYIAYNAWFRKVTGAQEDFEAIRLVMRRFVIWDDYIHGRTLAELKASVERMSVLGYVKDAVDWRGLIRFWYQTRCELFHGLTLPGYVSHDMRIQLSYESLHIFMTEIIRRMRHSFTDLDFERLTEVQGLLKSQVGPTKELRDIESGLYQKFILSPDIWNVDMERV